MEDIRNLMVEINDLKGKIDSLGENSECQVLPFHEAKLISAQVERIKRTVRTVKEEGSKEYNDLAKEEAELLKDIKALKEIVGEEASVNYVNDRKSSGKKLVHKKNKEASANYVTDRQTNVKKLVSKKSKPKLYVGRSKARRNFVGDDLQTLRTKYNNGDDNDFGVELSNDQLSDTMEEKDRIKERIPGEYDSAENEDSDLCSMQNEVVDAKETEMKTYIYVGAQNNKFSAEKHEMWAERKTAISVPQFRHAWDSKDHTQFVKIHHRCKRRERRMEEWRRAFHYKTEAEIEEHATSYEAYLHEKEEVKIKLDQWKSEKEKRRKELEDLAIKDRLGNEKRMKEMEKLRDERLTRERQERFYKLAEWKELQESKKVTGTLHEEIQPLVSFEAPSAIFSHPSCEERLIGYTDEERRQIAQQLEEYRQRREQDREIETAKRQEEIKSRKIYNAQSRSEFRKRDEEHVQYKKDQKDMEKRLKEAQKRRLEKIKSSVKVEASGSKDRLTQPTISHLAYTMSPQEVEAHLVDVDSIPRLATPMWRQDI